MTFNPLLSFWGKTRTLSDGVPSSKPLLHHLIDVAAAAREIQSAAPDRLAREAHLLGVDPLALSNVRSVLAGLHDLGKVARAFQAKSHANFPVQIFGPPDPEDGRYHVDHGKVTAHLLGTNMPDLIGGLILGAFSQDVDHVASTIGGHHGRPLPPDYALQRREAKCILDASAIPGARDIAETLINLFGAPPIALDQEEPEQWIARLCWGLAGLTTLADWVGSDAAFFDFHDTTLDADAYFPLAVEAAREAVAAKGLRPARAARTTGMRALFDVSAPRPMQAVAETVDLPAGPILAVIEDVTGTGKTEAALVLAHRMIRAGKAEGLYFALPTMATANAMFERLRAAHRRLFEADPTPSVALLHGRRELSESFAEVRMSGGGGGDLAAACNAWIADDRRRAFFADVGAGTIDQALLSVLPRRFLALRQQGLAGKVLIIDEAHAYDAYVGEELRTLMRFHAAAGGSAIVLSATLTQVTRDGIAEAFRAGLRTSPSSGALPESYPNLALHAGDTEERLPVDPAEGAKRQVAVQRIGDLEAALEAAHDAARQGAAVAVVRNAVDDAIEFHERLLAGGADSTLFHARFALCDRMAIEERAVADFGRNGRSRAGRILVATQVIEQSLDLDFDLMITDLAPVDLLVQRAGRLWRHDRGERPLDGPRLLVLSPDWESPASDAWLQDTQPKGRHVYRPGVMWRSAKAIFEAGAIETPDGLSALVEAAYSEEPLPEVLERADTRWEGEREKAAREHARQMVLDWENGYAGIGPVDADQEVPTRLGAPTVTLRLARRFEGQLRPWAGGEGDPHRAWAMSEVSVRKSWLGEVAAPADLQPEIDALRSGWPKFEQSLPVAVVEADGAILLLDPEGLAAFQYDATHGIRKSFSS